MDRTNTIPSGAGFMREVIFVRIASHGKSRKLCNT